MNEQEAKDYWKSLQKSDTTQQPDIYKGSSSNEGDMISRNNRIIRSANEFLLDRIESQDSSLRVSDVINLKSEAFKQNQLIFGNSDELDTRKLIPATINIQIINN